MSHLTIQTKPLKIQFHHLVQYHRARPNILILKQAKEIPDGQITKNSFTGEVKIIYPLDIGTSKQTRGTYR